MSELRRMARVLRMIRRRARLVCLLLPLIVLIPACSQRDRPQALDSPTTSVKSKAAATAGAPGSNAVLVSFASPGWWSARETDQRVTMAATRTIITLPGVESVESISRDSRALLQVNFAQGRDIRTERKALLGLDWTSMPDEVRPSLFPNMDLVPILHYELASDRLDPVALRAVQDKELRLAALRVSGVAILTTCGGSLTEVQVELDPQRSAAFGIDVGTVADVLRGFIDAAAGPFVAGTMETLGEAVVVVRDGRPLYITDLASLRHGPAAPTCLATRSGGPVVSVEVFAAKGSERASVSAALREVLKASERSLADRGIAIAWPAAPALRVRLRLPPSQVLGSRLESIDQVARNAAAQIARLPGVASVGVQIGIPDQGIFDGEQDQAELQIAVTKKTDVATLVERIAGAVQMPGVQTVVEALDSEGRPSETRWARIYGPDHDTLRAISSKVARALAKVEGVDNVRSPDSDDEPTLVMMIDRIAAAKPGITASVLADTLRAATEGLVISSTQLENRAIRLRLGNHVSPEELSALPVVSPAGAVIPLGQLVNIELRSEPATIRSRNARHYVEVRFRETNAGADTRAIVAGAVELPLDYELKWGAGAP